VQQVNYTTSHKRIEKNRKVRDKTVMKKTGKKRTGQNRNEMKRTGKKVTKAEFKSPSSWYNKWNYQQIFLQ
jgi:hypothetical protein